MNDRRLIEDFLPVNSVGEAASSEPRTKGHISTLHVWRARRPLVACRAAVYGALVPASLFVPENGPDNKIRWTQLSRQFFGKVKLHSGAVFVFIYVPHPRERRVIHRQVLPARGPFAELGGRGELGCG